MVRPSLARIGATGDGYATDRDPYWGSGFFIAPGWLLTSAHVVGKGGAGACRGESAMSVTWQERTAADARQEPAVDPWRERTGTGTAVLVAPGPQDSRSLRDPWPFPDLALVRVSGADDVPCLWLGDREAGPRTPLGLYGWSVQTGELGLRNGTGELAGSDARALLLAGSQPVGGLSGGPVLDLRQGSVIGVIKGRRREEGVAVPVTALCELLDQRESRRAVREVLRAHDLYHASRLGSRSAHPDWATFRAALPGHVPSASAVGVELRTRLYGHLAQLPPPSGAGEVVHLVEDVKERVCGERLHSLLVRNVRTWREGAALLYGLRALEPGGGGTLVDLDAVLVYAAMVARRAAGGRAGRVDRERLRAFTTWINAQAAGHRSWAVGEAIRALLDGVSGPTGWREAAGGAAEAPAGSVCVEPTRLVGGAFAARTDVLVKVGAETYGRHPWSVQLIYDGKDVTPVDADERGVPAEELARVLREPLARALSQGDHGEHLAAVEVFLPRRLFDLPVDEWQLHPGPPGGSPGSGSVPGRHPEARESVRDADRDGRGAAGTAVAVADDLDDDFEGDFEDDLDDERALPLGMRRTVVIREIRRNGREPSPEWRRRWKGALQGPLAHGTLHGRSPAEGHLAGTRAGGRYPFYGVLSAMGDARVPVYCGPVGRGEGYAAMRDALRSGHPVVLWRRDRHDHEECRDFHRQAADLLELARHADGLHGRVRELRIRLADPATARAHGLRGKIAVLIDPPDRPPYGAETMRPPPAAPDD
ncbi:hypothetical protein LK07_23710 [Streptomyces pluripotens]|uniref:vWA-MoxR associated protein C-terminal domain-containing protein n=1 Tax=Streptomyces pluripotens TaxID=1355015 RepID=A0A221P8T2_9ACTN|nr:trypsin-like peptidase domain-containing protein [Streptomyces pluripotens]ARP74372.1 hypothetical protein LK06_022545 [Streptomyces pluripotens]ASN28651.1 hypothetical protein LK07_23710 [Streptomyces pluripotens]